MPAAVACMDRATSGDIECVRFDISSDRYMEDGSLVAEEEIEDMRKLDSVLFGAIGDPRVKPGIMERGVILALRKELDLFLNLRPAWSLPFSSRKFKLAIARENMEEFYMGFGGKISKGGSKFEYHSGAWRGHIDISGEADDELYFNIGALSRGNVTRFFKKAVNFREWATDSTVTVVDKANAVTGLYEPWRDIASSVISDHGLKTRFMYGDAVAYDLVRGPSKFGLMAASNLYGDILSDLCAGLMGGLGYAPSGSYGSGRTALFEPVHGSAPDIAGKGIANPLGAILSSSMLLDHIGMETSGEKLRGAVHKAILDGIKPFDLGGSDGTEKITQAVLKNID